MIKNNCFKQVSICQRILILCKSTPLSIWGVVLKFWGFSLLKAQFRFPHSKSFYFSKVFLTKAKKNSHASLIYINIYIYNIYNYIYIVIKVLHRVLCSLSYKCFIYIKKNKKNFRLKNQPRAGAGFLTSYSSKMSAPFLIGEK